MDYPTTCQEGQFVSIQHHFTLPLPPPQFLVSWGEYVVQSGESVSYGNRNWFSDEQNPSKANQSPL